VVKKNGRKSDMKRRTPSIVFIPNKINFETTFLRINFVNKLRESLDNFYISRSSSGTKANRYSVFYTEHWSSSS
jgi:hypothetical protein